MRMRCWWWLGGVGCSRTLGHWVLSIVGATPTFSCGPASQADLAAGQEGGGPKLAHSTPLDYLELSRGTAAARRRDARETSQRADAPAP